MLLHLYHKIHEMWLFINNFNKKHEGLRACSVDGQGKPSLFWIFASE